MQHKHFLLLIILLMPLMLLACGKKDKNDTLLTTGSLTYQTVHYEKSVGDCDHPDSSCARISIDYPEIQKAPTEAAKETINRSIQNNILKSGFSGETTPNVEALMAEFINQYKSVDRDFPDYPNYKWVDEKEMKVLYSDADVASFSLNDQAFTGGAHGLSTVYYYNFALQDGKQLALSDLFAPGYEDELNRVGEIQFRKLKQLSAGKKLSSAGFWFENDNFKLNDNFAITQAGLAFYYNSYEIGPYVMGPTELLLPYENLKAIIPQKGILSKFIQN